MVVTYTDTNLRYSERDAYCECDVWAGTNPSPGTGRAALIRFEGGGFNRSDKTLIETQFPFFTNTDLADGFYDSDENIVVFSCNWPQNTYNSEGATDVEEFDTHFTTNPSYMDRWIMAAWDAINFAVENASDWDVDPRKIILSGSSAGGYCMSAAAYMRSEAFSPGIEHLWTRPHPQVADTGNIAMYLNYITPFDLSQLVGTSTALFHAGVGSRQDNSPSNENITDRVRRVSATHLMEVTRKKPMVFSWYDDPNTFDITDVAPYGPHSASWGVDHHNRLAEFTAAGDKRIHELYVEAEANLGELATATNNASWANLYGGGGPAPVAECKALMTKYGLL
jgi:hypothetical protein